MNSLRVSFPRFSTSNRRARQALAVAVAGAALLPSTVPAVVVSFSASDQGWTAATELGSTSQPFTWGSSAGVGGSGAWYVDGNSSASIKTLTSPAFTVQADGPVSLSVDHRHNFLFISISDDAVDGGQVRYSVNNGPWTLVNSGAFSANGYTGDIDGVDGLDFESGWSDTSDGYSTPAHITSTASFGAFTAGDTIQIQFRAGWNSFGPFSDPNWVISEVELGNAVVPEPAEYATIAGALLAGAALWRRRLRSRSRVAV